MRYLLDSDVFIQAKAMHYGFRVCPAFWCWLDREHANGKVYSIQQVRKELLKYDDELSNWVKSRKPMFLDADDGMTYSSLAMLSSWATANFAPAAQTKFFSGADFPLVGYAHAHGCTVVTQEKYADGFEIKIPKACRAMDVPCINTFELLEKEGAKFVLEGASGGS